VFSTGQDVVGHSCIWSVLESVQEIPIGYAIFVRLHTASGQESCQETLLQPQSVCTQDV